MIRDKTLHKIDDLLAEFDLEKRRRYIKKEYQAYGLQLADELNDWKNRSLYIKLARELPREILEKARLFVKNQSAGKVKSKARLFMWKLKELKNEFSPSKKS